MLMLNPVGFEGPLSPNPASALGDEIQSKYGLISGLKTGIKTKGRSGGMRKKAHYISTIIIPCNFNW
jgi:hypothetical protein